MARPSIFPSPLDRTVNEPVVLVSAAQVLRLYFQMNPTAVKTPRVTDEIKTWFVEQSKTKGWTKATFSGFQCLLEVGVSLLPTAPTPEPSPPTANTEKSVAGHRAATGCSSISKDLLKSLGF